MEMAVVIKFEKITEGRTRTLMANDCRRRRSEGVERKGRSRAKPFSALPHAEQEMLPLLRRRDPQKAPRKVPISIRLSVDVAEGLRAKGAGWQRHADEALRAWLRQSKKTAAR